MYARSVKLEHMKGGGGSIKIGTTGRISALISRELQYINDDTTKSLGRAFLEPNDANIRRKLKEKVQEDEASTSNNHFNEKHTNILRKDKHNHARKARRNTILHADNLSIIGSQNPNRKRTHIVEVVDVKCGIPDKNWANPIKDRFWKLSFSN